ncbi:MAG TPA: hypothetical protein VLE97_02695, partial [Gaiellaceae bacterium]|nr:hypothetical protein [Gaiellaceae bacterium]
DPTLEVFVPHHNELHANNEPLVYAVDTRYFWLYWFPRDCPRACWTAGEHATDEDVERFLDGDRMRRVAVIESGWLDPMRTVKLYAYRMPPETFEPWDKFFVSRETVVPLELVELGDLVERHERAGVQLTTTDDLLGLWEPVRVSSLDFSGIRLRNATLAR